MEKYGRISLSLLLFINVFFIIYVNSKKQFDILARLYVFVLRVLLLCVYGKYEAGDN